METSGLSDHTSAIGVQSPFRMLFNADAVTTAEIVPQSHSYIGGVLREKGSTSLLSISPKRLPSLSGTPHRRMPLGKSK